MPDLPAFMGGSGARIGEACGVRWLDLDLGTAKLGSLPVRVPGAGCRPGAPAPRKDQGQLPDGVSGRQVANQLGHAKPSMTMDHYMSRRAVTERAALVL